MSTFTDQISLFGRFVRRINDIDISQLCGLAASATSTKIKTVNAIVYYLLNSQYSLTATDPITVTACAQQAAGTFCYYLVSVNSTQTVTITKSTDNAYSLPDTPAGNTRIGAFKIVTVGVTFTAGTTAFDAAGITATFYDIDCGLAAICINQAMRGMERKHNFSGMEVEYEYSFAKDTWDPFTVPIPLYKGLKVSPYAYTTDGVDHYPIDKQDPDIVRGAYLSSQSGAPKMITEVPAKESSLTPDAIPTRKFIIRPKPDQAYKVLFLAYQYSPYMDNVIYTKSWWTEEHDDVLLYASLVEAAPYLKQDSRLQMWKAILKEKYDDLVASEEEEEYMGSSRYSQG